MNWYKIAKSETLEKEFIETLSDGVKVYLVNGGYVRDKLSTDFIGGGNWMAYPKFMPKNEVWVERRDTDQHDMRGILDHEIVEYRLMRDEGLSYEKAHEKANLHEKKERAKDQDVENVASKIEKSASGQYEEDGILIDQVINAATAKNVHRVNNLVASYRSCVELANMGKRDPRILPIFEQGMRMFLATGNIHQAKDFVDEERKKVEKDDMVPYGKI